MEAGIDEMLRDSNTNPATPARRLVWWYDLVGAKEARTLLLRFAGDERVNPVMAGGYWNTSTRTASAWVKNW